jgi:23S rRNA (uracil1939-C5)-methyltransferase
MTAQSRRRPNRPIAPLPAPRDARIDHVGAEGDGISVQPDGSRFFVPFTVPGDVIRARPIARRGDGLFAEIDSILEPGPERIDPVCAHFGICGGCVSQHWNENGYLAWKAGRLAVALRRAGFDDPSIAPIVRGVPATRRRMDLAMRRDGSSLTIGLHRARSNEVIDLAECAVLHLKLFELIAPLRKALAGCTAIRREASVVVNLLDSGPDVLLRTDAELTANDRMQLVSFARSFDLPRLSWARANTPPEPVCILRPPVTSLSGIAIQPPPGAFLQATSSGEAAIIAAVLDGLPSKRTAKSRVVELFAGCGTISFALATQVRVLGLEGDEALVRACHDAINRANLMGKVAVRHRDLARQPLQPRELAEFAAVVLDPPHAGAAAQMPAIAAARVPTVIYVSCDPFSLGRDAAVLHAAGYRLEKTMPIDQFLWSARVESVAVFRLN